MADQGVVPMTGAEGLEALTEDRKRMWAGFTTAVVVAVVMVTIILLGMAVFLL